MGCSGAERMHIQDRPRGQKIPARLKIACVIEKSEGGIPRNRKFFERAQRESSSSWLSEQGKLLVGDIFVINALQRVWLSYSRLYEGC